jgi:hypothetical protein
MKYKPVFVALLAASGLLTGCNVSPISSFGSAANGSETASATDPKNKPGESLTDAPLADSKAVKPLLSLEGTLDDAKALQAMYGNYNESSKRAQWKPTTGELDRFNFYSNIKTLYSRPYFSKAFQQEGAERYLVITRTAPDKSACEDCVPVLGGAIFQKAGEDWQLKTQTRALTRTGMHGTLSGGRLIKIGNDKYGVLFHWKASNLGVAEEGDLLIAETKAGLKEVFSMVTGGNNKQYCEQNGLYHDDPACWTYSSKLEFIPNANNSFYDIKITSNGNKQIEDNEVAPVRETKRFYFTESGYQPYRQ